MVVLTESNIESYIKSKREHLSFQFDVIESATLVTEESHVNWVFRVVLHNKGASTTLYLRQIRNYVKEKPEIHIPADRSETEERVLRQIPTILYLEEGELVPRVEFFDAGNHVLWLSDVRGDRPLLVSELQAGRVPVAGAMQFGNLIGLLHARTRGIEHERVRGSEAENVEAMKFHAGMRTKEALKRFPEATAQLLAESRAISAPSLVLGDLASKNIVVWELGGQATLPFRFFDLERTFIGDPVFDIAFLFAHFLTEVPLSAVPNSIRYIDQFMSGYRKGWRNGLFGQSVVAGREIGAIRNRLSRWVGVMLIYRLHWFYLAVNAKQNLELWDSVAQDLLTLPSNESLTTRLRSYFPDIEAQQ